MGHAPDGDEHFAARKTLLLTSGHFGLQVLLQTVYARIVMDPRISQERGIESLELFLEARKLQKIGALAF